MNHPDLVLVVPTLCAKNLIFRFLNCIQTNCKFRLLIDDSPSRSVGAKWNKGLELALELQVPAIMANDDIILWSGAIDYFLNCKELFVTGITTRNIPGNGDPIELTRGGFSFFMIRPELIKRLIEHEKDWPAIGGEAFSEGWPSFKPGLFDEEFYPAYFEDQDFFRRIKLIGVEERICEEAFFYHELKQIAGKTMIGASTVMADHDKFSSQNDLLQRMGLRYTQKWGGIPNQEKTEIPFQIPAN